jgi:F0F1-type ATP synthase gamma subunit
VQNEEQNDQTLWAKSKELDIPEPEKNEIILPDLPNTVEEVPEIADNINIEETIPAAKFDKYKKRITSEEDYHQRVEARINDLITKLDNKEIKLSDLSEQDRNVIIDILNQEG